MVSLVIPTYQERDNMTPLLERLRAVAPSVGEPIEVVIVDNRSSDGTAGCARALLGGTLPGRVIECVRDTGLAESVMEGARAASGDLLGVMDADLSHPPELLPQLVAAVRQGNEVALASRYVPGGGITRWPWSRRLASQAANWLARPLTPVADATSGYFVCRREVVTSCGLHPRGFKILLEILVRGRVRRVREVPYVFTDRVRGVSKLNGRTAGLFLMQLAALSLARVRGAGRRGRDG